MIKTEVKQLSDNEHRIDVNLPKDEYTRLYKENLNTLLAKNIQLPGFRRGKVPRSLIEKKFSENLHQDTISALFEAHYAPALEQSGLVPAVQPQITLPETQTDDTFSFQLTVTTWPDVKLAPLADLTVEHWDVTVDDADVDGVVERLMASQFRHELAAKPVEEGDKVCMDYTGYIDDEAFDGGAAENAELVIGSGGYIPGFEAQLMGAEAGQQIQVNVEFPENYQAEALAGKSARFEVDVKTVMKGTPCSSVDDLATLLGFTDEAALRGDSQERLTVEANKATLEKTRESMEEALVKANPIDVPERILQEHVLQSIKRYEKRRIEEGGAPLSDEEQRKFLSYASVVETKNLQISMIFQAIRKEADLTVTDDDVEEDLNAMAMQYPEEQRDAYINWMKTNKENREGIESTLLERKCVAHILMHSNVTKIVKTITELQQELDGEASTEKV